MLIDRIFVWVCDYCKTRVEKSTYGLPEGWVHIKRMGAVPHACGECALLLPTHVQTSEKKWTADCLTFEI